MTVETALRDRLRASLTDAMKARDAIGTSALRSALAAIDNAEAVDPAHAPDPRSGPIAGAVGGLRAGEVRRLDLSDEDVTDVVRGEITSRARAADDYDRLGRAEEAARVRAEAAVLQRHLDRG